MREWLDIFLPKKSVRRWVASAFIRSPLSFPAALFRSVCVSKKLAGRVVGLPVRIYSGQRLLVRRGKGAEVRLTGVLTVAPWGNVGGVSSISIDDNAIFMMEGDFSIGQNVHISLSSGAKLRLGGVSASSGSGITCDSRIMASRDVAIGSDTIIAWGTFITDSDWHELDGVVHQEAVSIGRNVWIAHDVSILRGAVVPDGSVVAAKSLVGGKFSEENLLLAGVPAKVVRRGVSWSR